MRQHPRPATAWWHGAAGYQVYVPSFADGDGDGLGDLRGLHDRLDYLAWLGVDLLWLTPFYPSPLADHGYDVADHRQVDPRFGSLEVFDALLAKAHKLGLRVLLDLVANHTSWRHPWFVASRASRNSPMRDWYLWRDGQPGGQPPNNWASAFGGPAWTYDPGSNQWWLHLHLPEQPDLNWANPAVAEAIDQVIGFWLDRGVDGFRVDVAHELVKHPDLPDNPPAPDGRREPGAVPAWQALEHRYDLDQPGVLEVHRRWRRRADRRGALLLGEVCLLDAGRLARYLRGDGLHAAFWLEPPALGWDPRALRRSLRAALAATPPGSLAWAQGSHDDQARAASRLGGGEAGRQRSLALATLLAGLPGIHFTYQGDELGLPDGQVPLERLRDPLALRSGIPELTRDRARTPMPWQPGPGLGFTTAARPWLPEGGRRPADTVAVQRADPASMLHRYRALLAARRRHLPAVEVPVEWLGEDGPLLAYRRGALLVAANCGQAPAALRPPGPGRWALVFATAPRHAAAGASGPTQGRQPAGPLELQPDHAVILRLEEAAGSAGRGGRLPGAGRVRPAGTGATITD
jgi:alpha-glucosidase